MSPIIILGGGVLVLLLLIVGGVVSITSERSLVEERLGRFLEDERAAAQRDEPGGPIITEWLNRRVAGSSMGDRIARELARADLKFKVAEYFALIFISTVATGF